MKEQFPIVHDIDVQNKDPQAGLFVGRVEKYELKEGTQMDLKSVIMGDVEAMKLVQKRLQLGPEAGKLLRMFLIDMSGGKGLEKEKLNNMRRQYLDGLAHLFTDPEIAPHIQQLLIGGKIKPGATLEETFTSLEVIKIPKLVSVSSVAKDPVAFEGICRDCTKAGCGVQLMIDVRKTKEGEYELKYDPGVEPIAFALKSIDVASRVLSSKLPVQFSLTEQAGIMQGPDLEFLKLLEKYKDDCGDIAYSGGLILDGNQAVQLLNDFPFVKRLGIGQALHEASSEVKRKFFEIVVRYHFGIGGDIDIEG